MAKSVFPASAPALAVAANATTPPGRAGDRIYSTIELAELVHDGSAWRRNAAGGAPLVAAGPSAGTAATGAAQSAQQGTANTAARSDHQHPAATSTTAGLMSAAQVQALEAASSASSTASAKPNLVAAGPAAGTTAAGAPQAAQAGQAATAARSDHWHPPASTGNAGLMTIAQVQALDAATAAVSGKPNLVAAGPFPGTSSQGASSANEQGTATTAARSDHVHPTASATVWGTTKYWASGTMGTLANGAPQATHAGTNNTAARTDHQHPTATTTNAGLMSIAQVQALEAATSGLAAKPNLVAAGTFTPQPPWDDTLAGVEPSAARADHAHRPEQILHCAVDDGDNADISLDTAIFVLKQMSQAAHAAALAKPDLGVYGTAAGSLASGSPQQAQAGVDATAARSDHWHPLATTTNAGLMSAAQANALANTATLAPAGAAGTGAMGAPQAPQNGAATTAARSDHQHPIATQSNAGLMSAAQVAALTVAAALVASGGTPGSATNGSPNATTQGTATTAARSDHWHPAATASTLGTVMFGGTGTAGALANGAPQAAQQGAATTASRSDHQHPIATTANAGLMSAAQVSALDAASAALGGLPDVHPRGPSVARWFGKAGSTTPIDEGFAATVTGGTLQSAVWHPWYGHAQNIGTAAAGAGVRSTQASLVRAAGGAPATFNQAFVARAAGFSGATQTWTFAGIMPATPVGTENFIPANSVYFRMLSASSGGASHAFVSRNGSSVDAVIPVSLTASVVDILIEILSGGATIRCSYRAPGVSLGWQLAGTFSGTQLPNTGVTLYPHIWTLKEASAVVGTTCPIYPLAVVSLY